jgi:hypothetical protein
VNRSTALPPDMLKPLFFVLIVTVSAVLANTCGVCNQ